MALRRFRLLAVPVALLMLPAACGEPVQPASPKPAASAAPAASASAPPIAALPPAPPEPPLPSLRTGPLPPREHEAALSAQIEAAALDGDEQIVAIDAAVPASMSRWQVAPVFVAIDLPAGERRPYAFLEQTADRRSSPRIWVRRPRALSDQPIEGHLYLASTWLTPGEHMRFHADPPASKKPDTGIVDRFYVAFAEHMLRSAGPFQAFAAQRLAAHAQPQKAPPRGRDVRAPRRPNGELAELMATMTGATSIQEALQSDRDLFLATAKDKPTIPVEQLAGPPLAKHPFPEMLRALGAPVPDEPLAAATPAEFHFHRFADLTVLFRMFDQIDAWATPIAGLLDRQAEDHRLSERYEAALGLSRGPLTRALGPEAIGAVAVVGSDPYVREGTDLTVIFQVKQRALVEAGLAAALGRHADAHGPLTTSKTSHDGVAVQIVRSADGAVSQHRATVGDLELVANSLPALERVIDAARGKRPRLSDEPDFRYMLARDARVRADVLSFMGDRFMAEVVGPRQKILEARRQIAQAELLTPGYAALLFGWLTGRSPSSVDELVKARLFTKDELKHANGDPITYEPGKPARSRFGTVSSLVPLIELGAPALVTEAERRGYETFSRHYQENWSTYIDPVMIRFALEQQPGGLRLVADTRILPIIDKSDYRDIQAAVGAMRIVAPETAGALRVALGVGEQAEVRRELGGLIGGFSSRHRLGIDWLGDWATVGVLDKPSLATSVADVFTGELPERPLTEQEGRGERPDELSAIGRAPLFAAIGLRSTAAGAIAIAAVRKVAEDALPGMLSWGELGVHREVSVVRVTVRDQGMPEGGFNVHYAFCEGALLLATRADVIQRLIDDRLDGKGTGAVKATAATDPAAPQLAVDFAPDEAGALRTIAAWFLEKAARDESPRSLAAAEALLFGAPSSARDAASYRTNALATLGAIPLTPDGAPYQLSPEGLRDPARGTRYAPIFPAVPVPGSPADRTLGALRRMRAELSFDDEAGGSSAPRPSSLHARLTLDLREK
jgi:hypothetical protein